MNRYGVYGEETIIPAAITVTHPNSLSWEHAAAIWMPYMTAYGALVDTALLAPGDAVIITAASEMAQVALFLLSDRASYISGQALIVDGGQSASLPRGS